LGELTPSEVEEIADAIISIPLNIETSKPLQPLALDAAMVYGIKVYDAMYIATAMVHEIRMVTADKKLVALLAGTDLNQHVSWLGNF
jgi:predicted nucleic acid-binding protein